MAELSLAVSHGSGLDVMCNIIDGSKIVPNWGQSSPHESQMTLLFAAVHCSPPMVVTKGISIAVMRCEVQLVHYTLHIDICYMLQLLRCCCSIVHCHYQWTVFCDNWELSQPMFYFRRQQSVCHNDGAVTECDTSRTISYLALSIVRMSIVHTRMFHHRTFHPPFIRASCSASCRRIRLLVPWGEDERAETWDPHIRCSRHRAGLNISSLFLTLSCSPASLCAIKIGEVRWQPIHVVWIVCLWP